MKTFYEFLQEVTSMGFEKSIDGVGRSTHKIHRYNKGSDAYFIKFPEPEMQSIVEHLAYKVYKLFGIKVPDSHIVVDENRETIGIATKGVSGSLAMSHKPLVGHKDINDGFFVDAFLANWDVMGLNFDNIIMSGDSAYRIDPGGSLTFRAQGGRKDFRFGEDPRELETLRNPDMSAQAGSVFSKMQHNELVDAAKVFKSVSWNSIEKEIRNVYVEALNKIEELNDEAKQNEMKADLEGEIKEISGKLKSRYLKILKHIEGLGV